jgi:hypothetical protein
VTKTIKPSYEYLKKLTKLREQVRQSMLGQDPQTQAELRFVESRVVEKMKEVQQALTLKV